MKWGANRFKVEVLCVCGYHQQQVGSLHLPANSNLIKLPLWSEAAFKHTFIHIFAQTPALLRTMIIAPDGLLRKHLHTGVLSRNTKATSHFSLSLCFSFHFSLFSFTFIISEMHEHTNLKTLSLPSTFQPSCRRSAAVLVNVYS